MKKYTIILALAAICCLSGCGKTVASGLYDSDSRYFDAWVHVQKQDHPEYEWKQTSMGCWILEDEQGKGEEIGEFSDSLYLHADYTYYDLEGNVSSTTSRVISQQVGTYDETNYYGPVVWYGLGTYAGLQDVITGMRVGGRRKAAIPSWLVTSNRFDSVDSYLANSDNVGSSGVYDVRVKEVFTNETAWEVDSIARYLVRNFSKKVGTDINKVKADSSGTHGFYYIQHSEPKDTTALKDTAVYINYIGRLLNGQVFDTTIRDTAIRYGLSRDKTYAPVVVNYGSAWSDITMGDDSDSVVVGFARTLSKMRPYEKGTGVFISGIGYKASGSGSSIPSFAPLRFDIELVDNPD